MTTPNGGGSELQTALNKADIYSGKPVQNVDQLNQLRTKSSVETYLRSTLQGNSILSRVVADISQFISSIGSAITSAVSAAKQVITNIIDTVTDTFNKVVSIIVGEVESWFGSAPDDERMRKVKEWAKQNEDANRAVGNLKNRMSSAESDITSLKKFDVETDPYITGLKNNLDAMTKGNQGRDAEINRTKQEIARLKREGASEADLNKAKQRLDSLEEAKQTVQSQLAQAKRDLARLEASGASKSELAQARNKITQLEAGKALSDEEIAKSKAEIERAKSLLSNRAQDWAVPDVQPIYDTLNIRADASLPLSAFYLPYANGGLAGFYGGFQGGTVGKPTYPFYIGDWQNQNQMIGVYIRPTINRLYKNLSFFYNVFGDIKRYEEANSNGRKSAFTADLAILRKIPQEGTFECVYKEEDFMRWSSDRPVNSGMHYCSVSLGDGILATQGEYLLVLIKMNPYHYLDGKRYKVSEDSRTRTGADSYDVANQMSWTFKAGNALAGPGATFESNRESDRDPSSPSNSGSSGWGNTGSIGWGGGRDTSTESSYNQSRGYKKGKVLRSVSYDNPEKEEVTVYSDGRANGGKYGLVPQLFGLSRMTFPYKTGIFPPGPVMNCVDARYAINLFPRMNTGELIDLELDEGKFIFPEDAIVPYIELSEENTEDKVVASDEFRPLIPTKGYTRTDLSGWSVIPKKGVEKVSYVRTGSSSSMAALKDGVDYATMTHPQPAITADAQTGCTVFDLSSRDYVVLRTHTTPAGNGGYACIIKKDSIEVKWDIGSREDGTTWSVPPIEDGTKVEFIVSATPRTANIIVRIDGREDLTYPGFNAKIQYRYFNVSLKHNAKIGSWYGGDTP